MSKLPAILITVVLASALSGPLQADRLRVAAAANFRDAIGAIAAEFERRHPHQVVLIFGATGKHYAQIVNGAPFDLFFAADATRPEKLEHQGISLPGRRFTYALGRLALWSRYPGRVGAGPEALAAEDYRHLAIANPALAPYGRAARESLEALGLWNRTRGRIVMGENVAQAYQFVASGNAELGLVAWSQLHRDGPPSTGSWWQVPPSLHRPIEQQAVQLSDSEAASSFFRFMQSDIAVEIIRSHGYGVPDDL